MAAINRSIDRERDVADFPLAIVLVVGSFHRVVVDGWFSLGNNEEDIGGVGFCLVVRNRCTGEGRVNRCELIAEDRKIYRTECESDPNGGGFAPDKLSMQESPNEQCRYADDR